MKILVACEFSGTVRDAFRRKGHDAYSCDLLPSEGDPTYHIQGDVLKILDHGWDMIIAHPPCTYLSKAGLHYNKTRPERQKQTEAGLKFFMQFYFAELFFGIPKIAIENPAGIINSTFDRPTQIIHPYHFGEPEKKETCLWLRGLPPLQHTNIVKPNERGFIIRKSGKRKGQKYHYSWRDGKTAHRRSVTFKCIADAMAEQWG